MNEYSISTPASNRRSEGRKVLLEVILVFVLGIVAALATNALSPRGLALTRNYFPSGEPVQPAPVATLEPSRGIEETNRPSASDLEAVTRLKGKGLQIVDRNQVEQLFRDPRYQQERIIFVDARNDDNYQQGHVPGAHQFDHYHPEKHIAAVLRACQSAEQIVVYCTGGECEDSEYATLTLRDAGVPNEKLFVFIGGINEWAAGNLPIETGARNSGTLRSDGK
jgi:rhodanese-related sulfurtransferase